MSGRPNDRSLQGTVSDPRFSIQIHVAKTNETNRTAVDLTRAGAQHTVPRNRRSTEPPSSPVIGPNQLSSKPVKSNSSRLSLNTEKPESRKKSWPAGSIEHDIDLVDESTTYPQIINLLVKHNCRGLTKNLRDVTRYPVCNSLLMNVHQGYLHDGTKLAIIKKVRPGEDYNSRNNSAGKFQKRLAMELYTWSQCDHRNVWPLMGLADFDGRLAIISVWADHGNLVQYLEKSPNANRCELVLGITTGLAYLHRNGIVHGDLKGLNVLISAGRTPMLCDFGNSVIEESTLLFADSRSGIGNTLRWAAPELLTGETQALSPATEVYSLGMTILETFTGKPPYANLSDHSVLSVIQKKKLPARPEKEVPVESPYGNILWTLLRSCWSHNPNMCPTVRAVRYILTPMTEESLRLAPLPEPAQQVEYDDSDKVDYSNQINDEDEQRDQILIKQEKHVFQSRLNEKWFAGTDCEVDDWEVDEQSAAGSFSQGRDHKAAASSHAILRKSLDSKPIEGQEQIQERTMVVQNVRLSVTKEPVKGVSASLRSRATTDRADNPGLHSSQIEEQASHAAQARTHRVLSEAKPGAHTSKYGDSRGSRSNESVLLPTQAATISLKQRALTGPEALDDRLRASQSTREDPHHSRPNPPQVPRPPSSQLETITGGLRPRIMVDMRDSWDGGKTSSSRAHANGIHANKSRLQPPEDQENVSPSYSVTEDCLSSVSLENLVSELGRNYRARGRTSI